MVEQQEPGKTPEQFEQPLPFSESAKQVMLSVEKEPRRLGHNLIGSEHLLLGLIKDPTIVEIFSAYNILPNRIRSAVEFIIGRGEGLTNEELELTPRFQNIIGLASQEARNADRQEIEPKDLLTGILREGQGVAAGVLESFGLTLEKFRESRGTKTIIKSLENEEAINVAAELDVMLKDPNIDPKTKSLLENTIRNAMELAKRAKSQPNS